MPLKFFLEHNFLEISIFISALAKISGVARDSLRNKGTREMNYGIIYKQS
jgi:hypothetical protein